MSADIVKSGGTVKIILSKNDSVSEIAIIGLSKSEVEDNKDKIIENHGLSDKL